MRITFMQIELTFARLSTETTVEAESMCSSIYEAIVRGSSLWSYTSYCESYCTSSETPCTGKHNSTVLGHCRTLLWQSRYLNGAPLLYGRGVAIVDWRVAWVGALPCMVYYAVRVRAAIAGTKRRWNRRNRKPETFATGKAGQLTWEMTE